MQDKDAIIRQHQRAIAGLKQKITDFDKERQSFQLRIQELVKENQIKMRRRQHDLTVLLTNKKILINSISNLIKENTNRGIQPNQTLEIISKMVMLQNHPSGDLISQICQVVGNFYGEKVPEQELMDKIMLMIQECQNLIKTAKMDQNVYGSVLRALTVSNITASSSLNNNSQISGSSQISLL